MTFNKEELKELARLKAMTPMGRLVHFIKERESIRIKKEAGIPKPWTKCPILANWRFCNVRRMDDKTSKWLYENWYKPNYGHPNMLVACVLARHVNLPSTLDAIGFPKKWKPSWVKGVVERIQANGITAYSGAYMIRADSHGSKIETIVDKLIQPIIDSPPKLNTSSLQECVQVMTTYWSIGSFMAGQIVMDLRWAVPGQWRDRFNWAPIGPGSLKGINYLLDRPPTQRLAQLEFEGELIQVRDMCKKLLPNSITDRLEMMDYQNCLCEYRAYHQAVMGIKNPKRKYK